MSSPAGDQVYSRTVLIEKLISFSNCKNPYIVPDYVWIKANKELYVTSSFNAASEYVASKILAPMLKDYNYEVYPMIYDATTFVPYKKIEFKDGVVFNVSPELMSDLSSMYSDKYSFEILKEFICHMWDNTFRK